MALTAKRRIFVEAYLKCWNGREAAEQAGYTHPRRQASRLLTNVDIKSLIKERLAAMALGTDEVLSRLGEQARGEWADYITTNAMGEPMFHIEAMREDGKLHLLKSITSGSRSGTKVEGYDAQAALVHIGKHLGMFKTRVEHSGPDGKPIPLEFARLARMSDDELLAEHRRLKAELALGGHAGDATGPDATAEGAAPLDAQPRAADGGPPY